MRGGRDILIGLALLIVCVGAAEAWILELRPETTLDRPVVRLRDVAVGEIPAEAGDLVLRAGGKPGETATLDRSAILRRLVTERLAGDVTCQGPQLCKVSFSGRRIASDELETRLLAVLGNWMPRDPDRGPGCWLELSSELPDAVVGGNWRLEIVEPGQLDPGRNLVRCKIVGDGRVLRFTATVTCHSYGEVARAARNIAVDDQLDPGMFVWEWRDLTEIASNRVIGRASVAGMSARTALGAGDELREVAIRPVPLVRQGETVDLVLDRGGVAVTLRGTAREDGVQGESVYVRNEIDGRLIRARVTGPGRLVWSRR